jgi:hypothetical protein
VEEKYLGKNPITKFIANYKFNKFCKETMRSSPSLGVLWYFADFVKLAERVYFYGNTKDSSIYSSKSYQSGQNGFIINDKDNELRIVVLLDSDEQSVRVEIKRTTEHMFINNAWTEDRENYDEVLIDNAIGIINSHMVSLLKWCWNKKGSYDSYSISIK